MYVSYICTSMHSSLSHQWSFFSAPARKLEKVAIKFRLNSTPSFLLFTKIIVLFYCYCEICNFLPLFFWIFFIPPKIQETLCSIHTTMFTDQPTKKSIRSRWQCMLCAAKTLNGFFSQLHRIHVREIYVLFLPFFVLIFFVCTAFPLDSHKYTNLLLENRTNNNRVANNARASIL